MKKKYDYKVDMSCKCGNIYKVDKYSLKAGTCRKDCGCGISKDPIMHKGEIFGDYISLSDYVYRGFSGEFKCKECGELRNFSVGYALKKKPLCKKKNKNIKHGMRYKSCYQSWFSMKQRCNNKNYISYPYYGGKGITYNKKRETFMGFREDMKDGRKTGLTIDRKDPRKNYEKSNCRRITRGENIGRTFSKPVYKTSLYGNNIREYKSIREAINDVGGCYRYISMCCKGERLSYRGFGRKRKTPPVS